MYYGGQNLQVFLKGYFAKYVGIVFYLSCLDTKKKPFKTELLNNQYRQSFKTDPFET